MSQKIPMCAKIWEYMLSTSKYESYANNIDDICAKDSLTDTNGLTVILPDKKFIDSFNNNIHGDGTASCARRMLMNTVIRKYLPDTSDFESFSSSVPFRSGLTLEIDHVEPKNDKVIFTTNHIEIQKVKAFKCPPGFQYSVWEVIRGEWPIEIAFSAKKKSSKKDKSITTGGTYMLNVGHALRNSYDTKRVTLLTSILQHYRENLISTSKSRRGADNKTVDPLLIKCVSLYNWLSMYAPEIYLNILPITDVSPGINLLIQILDPNSLVNDVILFGGGSSRNRALKVGWNNTVMTQDPYSEWLKHIKKSEKWSAHTREYNKSLLKLRNELTRNKSYSIDQIGKAVSSIYVNMDRYIFEYVKEDHTRTILNNRYRQYPGRKLWEDQLRYIGTSTFSGYDDIQFVRSELTESLQNLVSFRPIGADISYEKAASFTYESGKLMSQEDYFLAFKWLFSTCFLFMPDSISEPKSLINIKAKSPYNGKVDDGPSTQKIINCHAINYIVLELQKNIPYYENTETMYRLHWQLQNSTDDPEQLEGMLNKFNMSDYAKVGGDKFTGGNLEKDEKKKHKRRVIQRGDSSDDDSDDDSDDENDLAALANLTFMVGPDLLAEDDEADERTIREKCAVEGNDP